LRNKSRDFFGIFLKNTVLSTFLFCRNAEEMGARKKMRWNRKIYFFINKTKVQLFRIYSLYLIAFEKIPSFLPPTQATDVIEPQPKRKNKYM
jgi:hypothetical protein